LNKLFVGRKEKISFESEKKNLLFMIINAIVIKEKKKRD
jgi:hypothetical protein